MHSVGRSEIILEILDYSLYKTVRLTSTASSQHVKSRKDKELHDGGGFIDKSVKASYTFTAN